MEEGELKLTLMDYLKPSDRCPNGLLLCVDEAHLLSVNLMEELRMMTNLVRDGKPLTRLVLAGNVSIEERLADPKLESLCQRISTRAYLESMNATECRRYIEENINSVSEKSADLFENDAMEAVYLATHGVPRLVNQVCDQALVMAVNCGVRRISEEMINEAWSEIQRLPVEWHVLGNETESNDDNVVEFGSLDELPGTSGRAEDFTQNDANPESNLIHEESPETEFDSESKSRDSGCGEPEFNSGGETQLAGSDREDEPVIETFSHVDRRSIGQPAFSTEIGLSVDSDLPDPDAQLKDEIPEVPASELQVQKPIEDRISQAVSDLTKEISRSTDPGEAITDPVEIEDSFSSNDDRDMIIVQDEPSSGPVETVPIQEIEVGETSTQAKREDYHRLFDRLRNG